MSLQSSSPRDFAHTHNILRGLPQSFSARLLSNAKKISLQKGQVLFAKGDAGDGCYWLDTGILKVCIVSNSGEQRILAVLGQGAIVGELAMLDGLPRSATVEAIHACRLDFREPRGLLAEMSRRLPGYLQLSRQHAGGAAAAGR